jgi:hypothetical protein
MAEFGQAVTSMRKLGKLQILNKGNNTTASLAMFSRQPKFRLRLRWMSKRKKRTLLVWKEELMRLIQGVAEVMGAVL